MLPSVSGTCPTFANGSKATLSANGQTLQADVWMGSQGGGPFIFYWHGTASSATSEVPDATPMQDPSNIPPAIAAHGAIGSDTLVLDLAQASAAWESLIAMDHGTYVDCNDGGNHLDFFTTRAPNLKPVALSFFNAHPFGIKPERYTSLPSGFPSYCALNAAGTPP
jgi:hypothetical protein